jgi:phospholipase D1/2
VGARRWRALALPSGDVDGLDLSGLGEGIAFGPTELAFSRTEPQVADRSLREIEQLFIDAIDAADCLIYLETQYFSSRRIYEALVRRMRAAARPRLDIVIVVNERAEAVKEELAVGLRQATNLQGLREVAAASGHALGVYYSLCMDANDTYRVTYVHSKVAIVDDCFLTVGSANLTNRSLSVDSELHASWEAPAGSDIGPGLARSIRRVRVSLLAEHSGQHSFRAVRALARARGLVGRLDRLAASGARLQPHGPPTSAQLIALELVDPQDLPFDPEIPSAADARREPTDEHDRRGVGHAMWSAWARVRRAVTPRRARRADSPAA